MPNMASQMDEEDFCSSAFYSRVQNWSLGSVQHVTIIKLKANIDKNMQQDLEVLKTIHTV